MHTPVNLAKSECGQSDADIPTQTLFPLKREALQQQVDGEKVNGKA